ncbi:MAG: ABC transporter permease subunit [Acidobacteria bacterium]|nr:ABC transporter permease subunit [Acidobacteriota bacterium]
MSTTDDRVARPDPAATPSAGTTEAAKAGAAAEAAAVGAQAAARRRRLRPGQVALAVALPLVAIALWQVAVWVFAPREWILPSPVDVARAGWDARDRLWFHMQWTILIAVIGLALAIGIGSALAYLIARSRIAWLAAYPWIIVSQVIPLVALAPLLVLWFPPFVAILVLAVLMSIFPVVVAGVDGLRGTDRDLIRAARGLGAEESWTWHHVRVPAALPRLFTGMRLAAVFVVSGAVVGELVASERGLGALTRLTAGQFETAITLAAVVLLGLIGLGLFGLIALAERIALPWTRRATRRGA